MQWALQAVETPTCPGPFEAALLLLVLLLLLLLLALLTLKR